MKNYFVIILTYLFFLSGVSAETFTTALILDIGKSGLQINRYKGLGEMNPDQLWETTLDQNERVLLSVKINEVDAANKAFEDLMGGETEARKKFIAENSLKVANLDI